MNIMGMGMMELAVVLLVAFVVLGPGRSIDFARRTGRVLGDLRRTFTDVTDAISDEERQRSRPAQPAQPAQPPPGVPSRPDLPDDDDAPPPATATDDPGGEAHPSPDRGQAEPGQADRDPSGRG